MKIQCDVCHKQEASFFCPADEAALCHACDRTIHHANKLASKHKRFSLHHPTSKDSPLCDICQERRAYLFCTEDRAILCRECDVSIHGTNDLTKKHNRFLLTGVKLGTSSSSSYSDPTSFSSNSTATEVKTSRSKISRPSSFSNENISSSRMVVEDNIVCDTGSVSASNISEYLTQTIPDYCIEDLLDASFASNIGFSKNYEHQSAFESQDLGVNMYSFPMQASQPQARSPQLSTNSNIPRFDSLVGIVEMPKAKAAEEYSNWRYNDYNNNNGYKVPSISPPLIKKCRRSY